MTGPNPQIGENGLPVVNRYITKINSEGKAILASEPDSLNVWQRIGKVANFFLGYTTRTFPTSLKDDNDIKSYAKDFGEPPGLSSSGDDAVWTPDDQATTNDSATLPYRGGRTVINGDHSVYKAANDWSDVLQEVRHIFLFCRYSYSVLGTNYTSDQ